LAYRCNTRIWDNYDTGDDWTQARTSVSDTSKRETVFHMMANDEAKLWIF